MGKKKFINTIELPIKKTPNKKFKDLYSPITLFFNLLDNKLPVWKINIVKIEKYKKFNMIFDILFY